MKVSDLDLSTSPWVENDQDGHTVLSNEWQRQQYIIQFGNVEIFRDSAGRYAVPAFADLRKDYIALKLEHCKRYGSK